MRDNVDKFQREQLAMARSVQKVILSSTLASVRTAATIGPEILTTLSTEVEKFEEKALRQVKIILEMSQISSREATGSKAVQCLLQDMVEYSALLDMYRAKVRDMQTQLRDKEIALEELKALTEQNNINRAVPDIAIKIAAMMENPDKDCLVLASLLKNLIHNRGTPVKRWSDETKSLFATILDYGGPALAKIVKDKIGGPSLNTMYRTARCNYAIPIKLEENAMKLAASFYKKIGYNGVFQLAIDATAVIPTLRVKGNKLIGLATESECVLTTAQDIIDVVKAESNERAKQANAFLLAPLQDHVPSFVLAISPVYKGQDHALVNHWFNQVALWGYRNGMKVVGLGADGDSKVRKYYVDRFKKREEDRNDIVSLHYNSFEFNVVVEDYQNMDIDTFVPTLMFPDWRHLIKKWRNQLLNVKRILIIGEGTAQIEHIIKVLEKDRIRSGLWKSDVFVKDKQNVNAAMRILRKEVRVCMKEWSDKETLATRAYLQMGQYLLEAYTERELTVQQRAKLAWAPVTFLQYWRAWLKIEGYDARQNFISQQTFDDTILAGHSLILSMKMFSVYFPNHVFHPWTFGSQKCEELFGKLRCFCRGKPNLSLLDMIDFSGRVQKLEELKLGVEKEAQDMQLPQWPQNIDDELKAGMIMAEKEVLKTLELIGMLPALVKGNILKLEGDDIININTPEFGTFAVWDAPDENEVISSEDLFDLDNEVLLTAIEDHGSNHFSALVDLAATASLDTDQDEEDKDDDEDSPTHCSFYNERKCKYLDKSFIPPKNTHWVGCSYPNCKDWYHEQCLSLQFATDKERDEYTLICPKHTNIREHFRDKLVALESDKHSLVDENVILEPLPKRLRVDQKTKSAERQTDYSIRPNYVEHEGQHYHMAEFLSLQEGKVYRPATSRLARWMESARNDFYEKIENLMNPQRVETGTYINDIVALWIPSEGLQVAHIVRIVRSPSLKSNFPVFEWRSDSKKREKVTICLRVLNYEKKDSLGWELETTPTYRWSEVHTILKVVGKVSGSQPKWPIYVYLTDILKELPRLQKMDEERKKKEDLQRKDEREKIKQGNPNDMTITLLREILDEMGEPYKKSWKKTVLIEKVIAAREKANNMTCTASATSTVATGHESTTSHSLDTSAESLTAKASTCSSSSTSSRFCHARKIVQPSKFIYYFDEKKERVIHLLLLLLFMIDLINAYMANAIYLHVINTLMSIQATLIFEELTCLFSVLLALLLLLLTCFMFAQVNVNRFCGDSYSLIDMGSTVYAEAGLLMCH